MPNRKLTRRGLIASGAAAPAIAALHEVVPHKGLHGALGGEQQASAAEGGHGHGLNHANPGEGIAIHDGFRGSVDVRANGFDPSEIVRDFDYGKTTRLGSGRV